MLSHPKLGTTIVLCICCGTLSGQEPSDNDPTTADTIVTPRTGILFSSDSDRLLVREVAPGTPGARAQIQPGDTLVMIDDKPFAAAEDVESYLTTLQGEGATMIVLRDGGERALIYVNELADVDTMQVPVPRFGQSDGIGVRIAGSGQPLVVAVWDESPASQAGILPGDRFVAVNGIEFLGTNAFVAAIAATAEDDDLDITLRRDGIDQIVTVQPERWTLVFDDEPEYLDGWRERESACDRSLESDHVLFSEPHAAQLDSLQRQIEELQAEIVALREQVSRFSEVDATAD